ncbi:hypothetical protein BCY84_11623 [Trypanosoma cruzi cruzi]|nr:hypothetical protein BCY84_11621 [Trypanosoma cruzi cruzi]PBJ74973.1 hypothetical protein BCY84_11623 [Trypanosoma cruzi cruzi]
MHAQNTDCSGFGCFFCSVCWRLRVAAASSVGMKGRRREGAHAARHFCCWRDAPPVTSLSRAPNPIVGVMTGNFVATSWMDADPLLRVALWVITGTVSVVCWLRGRGRIPLATRLNWRRWRCVSFPRPLWVNAGGARVFCVEGRILPHAVWQHCDLCACVCV